MRKLILLSLVFCFMVSTLLSGNKTKIESELSSLNKNYTNLVSRKIMADDLNYLIEEDFDAGGQSGTLPDGWSFENSNANCKNNIWSVYWNSDYSNGFLLYYPYFNGGWQSGIDLGRVITATYDLTGVETAAISFLQNFNYYSGSGVKIGIEYRIAGSDWTVMWEEIMKSPRNEVELINIAPECLNQDSVEFAIFYDGEINEINYWIIDDFKIFEPPVNEVFVLENNLNVQVEQGAAFVPQVNIQSFGSATNNFNMICQIFHLEEEVYNQVMSVETLNFLDKQEVNFPEFVVPEQNAAYNFCFYSEYETLEGNYNSDSDTSTGWIDSNNGETNCVIFEEFTNTGCGPCASVNPNLKVAMNQLDESKFLPIFVHVSWPSSADPYYTPIQGACDARVQYYGITGVPHGVLSGEIHPNIFSNVSNNLQNDVTKSLSAGVPFLMTATSEITSDGFSTEVTIDMIGEVRNPGNVKMRIVTVENGLTFNAPNNEKSFDYVLRDFYPSVSGTVISLEKGQSETYSVEGTYKGSWEEQQVEVFAFIQNDNNKRILQAIKLGQYTGIDNHEEKVVNDFMLEQNYPNPFNPSTTISFSLPQNNDVKLTVYDVLGREIKSLVNGEKNAGSHSVKWDATNNYNVKVPAGIYFYKLQHNDNVIQKKMLLLK